MMTADWKIVVTLGDEELYLRGADLAPDVAGYINQFVDELKQARDSRYELMQTLDGYMIYDRLTDDYVHDNKGDNLFDDLVYTQALLNKVTTDTLSDIT